MPDFGMHFWDGFVLGGACVSVGWIVVVVWLNDRNGWR